MGLQHDLLANIHVAFLSSINPLMELNLNWMGSNPMRLIQFSESPLVMLICHCTDCQRATGSERRRRQRVKWSQYN